MPKRTYEHFIDTDGAGVVYLKYQSGNYKRNMIVMRTKLSGYFESVDLPEPIGIDMLREILDWLYPRKDGQ